jgi:hypothetical protein
LRCDFFSFRAPESADYVLPKNGLADPIYPALLFVSAGYACSAFISIFQLQMAIRSIQLRDNERSLIKRIYNATIAANVIAELLLGASLIGNLVATDWIVELGWMRAQMVATLISFHSNPRNRQISQLPSSPLDSLFVFLRLTFPVCYSASCNTNTLRIS